MTFTTSQRASLSALILGACLGGCGGAQAGPTAGPDATTDASPADAPTTDSARSNLDGGAVDASPLREASIPDAAADADPSYAMCAEAGGTCISNLNPGACSGQWTIPCGDPSFSDLACCVPGDAGAADAGDGGALAQLCRLTFGQVGTMPCCAAGMPFPDTCAVGACSCSPSNSVPTPVCSCPPASCFSPAVGCTVGPDL
jgi:hypothetical protein